MNDKWEEALAVLLAMGFMIIAAIAIGQIIDNQAARIDPASPYATKEFRK